MKGKLKQNRKKKKGNAVLQKYMVAMDEFIKSKSGAEEVETDHGMRFVKRKSRKELRKEERKLKKAKMKFHYEGKKSPSLPPSGGKNSGIPADELQQKKKIEKAKKEVSTAHSSKSIIGHAEKTDDSKTPSSPRKRKNTNKLQESRKMALLEANEEEDREIKKLERCLGFNKRKNKKTIPQSFVADGLDYILGVLDSGSSAMGMYDDDDDDVDMAKENFEKLDETDSDLSHEDGNPGEEMASEGSDEDMSSSNDENDDDDAMGDEEEEAEANEMDDDSDAADSDDENEVEAEHEADTPETKTSASEIETVN